MLVLKSNVYVADFETTSYENLQKDGYVRVWLWSLINCETYQSWYGYDIKTFLLKLIELQPKICYFHNLKFDGSFLASYFLEHKIEFELIAPNNVWYAIRWNGIEFRDSLKKFRTTVKELAHLFNIPEKLNVRDDTNKNTWDYYIPIDYKPTQKEIDYCVHDSYIVAYGISQEWDQNRKRLTNSSESYHNAKNNLFRFDYYFPEKLYPDMDKFARGTYNGGECGVNPIYQNQELTDIYGYDVNGLYGYVLDELPLPYDMPYWGEPVSNHDSYMIWFDCEFYVKDKMFPFLHIKRNLQYYGRGTEHLKESDGLTTLKMTAIDYELFKKHYHVYNECNQKYLSVKMQKGILHPIIKKNLEQKEYYSTPEHRNDYLRQVAKDNTNMLYGSFGISTIKDTCVPTLDDDGVLLVNHIKDVKNGRYIPMATFTTAHLTKVSVHPKSLFYTLVKAKARKVTITAIQQNYKNWIYSDTDSMYLTKPAKGIKIDPKKSGYWKFETYGDFDNNWNGEPFPRGKFLRPKTYCLADEKYTIYEKYDKVGRYKNELRCAGMPDSIKATLTGRCKTDGWDKFYIGASFDGKLQHTVVRGGVCLMPRPFNIR